MQMLIVQGALDDNVLPIVQEKFASTYKAAGGDWYNSELFEGCVHEWVAQPRPQTEPALVRWSRHLSRGK